MNTEFNQYPVKIAGLDRVLPLFEVKPGLRVAILNILGDTELVRAAARELHGKLSGYSYDIFVTPETKSIPLAYALSIEAAKQYVVLRKSYKSYMGDSLSVTTNSITTGATQTLYLDSKDRVLLEGKRIVLVDDVISTGSTLQGMRALMEKTRATVVAEAAIFTEGEISKWRKIISLGHLPTFVDDQSFKGKSASTYTDRLTLYRSSLEALVEAGKSGKEGSVTYQCQERGETFSIRCKVSQHLPLAIVGEVSGTLLSQYMYAMLLNNGFDPPATSTPVFHRTFKGTDCTQIASAVERVFREALGCMESYVVQVSDAHEAVKQLCPDPTS